MCDYCLLTDGNEASACVQTVMGMTLVHGCLNFKYLSTKEITLREFTNAVALAMRAKEGGEGEGGVATAALCWVRSNNHAFKACARCALKA